IGELTQLVAEPGYGELHPREKRFLMRQIRIWSEKNQFPDAIRGALYFAETHPAFLVTPDMFDAQSYLYNVKNGTIDLRNGKMYAHNPEDFLRQQTDVVYDSDATCPNWEEFIDFVFDGNAEIIRTFQQAVGYGLWGTNEAKKFFILL